MERNGVKCAHVDVFSVYGSTRNSVMASSKNAGSPDNGSCLQFVSIARLIKH